MKTASKLIMVILIFCSLTGMSQRERLKHNKFNIALVFSPDISISKSKTTMNAGGFTVHDIQQKPFNFSTGLIGYLTIKRKYEIGTGIIYSSKDIVGTWSCNYCDQATAPQPELVKLRYIEIPVLARYHLSISKLDLFVEPGLTSSLLTNEPIRYGTLPINKFLLSGQFGLGINIDLGKRINLTGTTMYRHSLTDSFINADFRFQSIGLVTGIIYKL